jgi:ribA/ribD-fused uncharacterized protein
MLRIRDRETLVGAWNEGQRFEFLMFWGRKGHDTSKIGPYVFSQWHFSDFEIAGQVYPTAEHFMMSQKALAMDDFDTLAKILECAGPDEAKALGRQVSPWVQEKWDEVKFEAVVQANVAKFSQDPELKEYILGTGDMVLVEASPEDKIWGIGLRREDKEASDPNKWRGRNLLGFALMEARHRIREMEKGA